jgi:hypothetical protein
MYNFTPRPSQQTSSATLADGSALPPSLARARRTSSRRWRRRSFKAAMLQDEQEVLIVTLVNSAVDNFESAHQTLF